MSGLPKIFQFAHHPADFDLIKWYLRSKLGTITADLYRSSGHGHELALSHQRFAQKNIPAYKDFLAGHKGSDWSKLPITSKSNYMSKYSLDHLVPGGQLAGASKMISLSSGASGKAFYWPRGEYQEIEGAIFHEQLLVSQFGIDKHTTLVVVVFSMGSYLAGTYTLSSIRHVASKGYKLTVVSPGINPTDAIDMIQKLAPMYEQVIIAGYPPFIKDILEYGSDQGISWSKYHLKLLLASEFFSEKWRDGIAKLAGIDNVITDTTNIFGASEGTLFGWETQEAICIRRLAAKDQNLHLDLFGSQLTPTLVEYNPALRFFEVEDGKLILTAWAGIPLIRYDLRDYGGILTSEARASILKKHGYDLKKELGVKSLSKLPMVYVMGRVDLAASIYGVLIYPEYIKSVLDNDWSRLTGKFTIVTRSDNADNAELIVHIELKRGSNKTTALQKNLEKDIKSSILSSSREYSALYKAVGDKAAPRVILHKYKEDDYFSTGVKQRWISQT